MGRTILRRPGVIELFLSNTKTFAIVPDAVESFSVLFVRRKLNNRLAVGTERLVSLHDHDRIILHIQTRHAAPQIMHHG